MFQSISSEFDSEDITVWTKFFDRSQILNDNERNRMNQIFNKLVLNIVKYEREQDFQLLEAFSKRILNKNSNEDSLILINFDQDRLNKLRTLCKQVKHYISIEKLLSTILIRDKSNDFLLPPINRISHQNRSSSISYDDTHISLPNKKKQKTSDRASSSTRLKSNPILMHGPLTLQNIYQALPAATLQFAEDEYVWHANRPVNMILSTSVQLPNVLTESIPNVNLESEQFFSNFIENLVKDYEKRHPSDHYAALRQWKQKSEGDLLTPRRMNGFETLIDLVQRKHLGKLQRYFLNVVSTNRYFNPYDLITVSESQVDPENHYVFSVFGILHIRNRGLDVEFFDLAEWYRHAKLWHACRQIPFCRDFLVKKQFDLWLANARYSRFLKRRKQIETKHLLFMNNRIFQMAIIDIRRVILEYEQLALLPKLFPGMILSLNNFELMIKRHTKDTIEYTKKFYQHIKTILQMTRDSLAKKFHLILKSIEQDQLTFNQTFDSIYEQRIRKENLRKELNKMQNDLNNLCPFINLCSSIISSCLCDIQRQQLSFFHLTHVTFLTKLHLNDYTSNRMLNYLPSWDDYQEFLLKILQQPQTILHQQWKEIFEFDRCLNEMNQIGETIRQQGLTNQCEQCGENLYPVLQENSCQCRKQPSKVSNDQLIIKGKSLFVATGLNQIIPFENIFTKDSIYFDEIKRILSDFRHSFDELDVYCESNEWLCEINRFCLQWTPNQMKQMSEGRQVFLIEEQLNLLRGWIDKTRTFELIYSTSNSPYSFQMDCSVISQDLCKKIETIYDDLGKYLYRYACSNAQILIEKFQTALQIFQQRPLAIEEFAKYASYLIPHKFELSSNQQIIDYFTNLFEMIFMHFGYLREENEQIEKTLTDTWKLFQKTLSDAADFVAQQTLIIKERLRDTFEKYLVGAELLYNKSTSGIFLDSTQDPMEIVKILKQNCLEFLRIEKQLRQYAEWRTLLAVNSLNSTDADHVDAEDLQNITDWSNNIDLRKDLWKYLEITTSSIKEWKNTLINKFNIRRAQEKIECWLKIAEDFKEKLADDDPIVVYWIEILEDFEQNIELLKKLLSDAMTIDQWKLLFRANGHDYDPQFHYRIEDLIHFHILQIENQDVFNQIHKQATREQKLKEKLVHMQTWLSDLHYRMAKYRPAIKLTSVRSHLTSSYRQRLSRYRELRTRTSASDTIIATDVSIDNTDECYIMINSQEILRLIEDRLLLLHTNEPFSNEMTTRHEQFQQYYNLFDNVKEMTQLWFETQTKWIYLRSALANFNHEQSNDFKEIFLKFNEVDENFRNFQKLAFQNPSVAGLAKIESNRIHFRTWLQTFNDLVNEIDFYLTEQYRSKFGRFYFLSTDELVQLISMGLDPRFYLPYVRQLFQGIQQIQFHLPEQLLGTNINQTMNSATIDVYAYRLEGVSIKNHSNEELKLLSKVKLSFPRVDSSVGLSTHLISSQSLTKWFQSLEYLMRVSLKKLLFEYVDRRLDEILVLKTITTIDSFEYPQQIRLIVEHFLFIFILEKQIRTKSNLSRKNLKLKIEDQINSLITTSNKKQNSFLLQQLYFRDILSKLIEKDEHLNLNSYEWLSIIKYDFNRTDNQIDLIQFSNRIRYQFEFIEPSSTFIISPMIERTIFELTQSISNYRLGVLHAPQQYGRSSIVQTLAQLCGINCMTIVCHSKLTVDQMENYHQGLILSNSWCLFKDIHHLSDECLSMLSICIRQIRCQLEQNFNETNKLKRSQSQSDLNLFEHTKKYRKQSNEYPMLNKSFQKHSILTKYGDLCSYPFAYGLFATFDQHYQPLSSTIKFDCRTISMSYPDLKLICQSLLYKSRLFTINEQEDCRELADNLVHLIESIQLIFDEIQTICSPYILLQSIIEQSRKTNLRKSIRLVCQHYQIDHVHLQQLIDQFFPDNFEQIQDKDDELCYVESILQEAYDDKLQFDDEEIYNNTSRLMYALKRNHLVFLIGSVGTAKTSLIRLAERTINKQISTLNDIIKVNVLSSKLIFLSYQKSVDTNDDEEQKLVIVNKVYPNSFDENQFYGNKNSFLEQWKRSYSTTISTETTNDQYWLVFDLDSHSNWLTSEKIELIYNEILELLSRHNGSIKILIECDQLPIDLHKKSSIFTKTFVLKLNKFSSQIKLIEKAVRNLELKLHLLDSTLSSIRDFFTEIIEPYIEYLENEHICEIYINNYTDSFIKILSAFIEEHLIDVQQYHHGLKYIFAYAFIWAFVHPIHFKYEKQINEFVRNLLKSYEFPLMDCKLTDFYPSMDASTNPCFIHIHNWLESRQIHYDCILEYESYMRLMSILISNNYPIGLFSYEQGFGKTTLIKQLLANFYYIRYVSDGCNREQIRKEIFEYNSQILTHGKLNRQMKFIIWFDDLQKQDSELIRFWINEKQSDFNYILTGQMNFYSYSLRLTRHVVPIILNENLSHLIESIYSIQIKNWLEEFSVEDIHHPIELAHACCLTLEEIFDYLIKFLTKYQWNLHHVEQIVNGLVLLNPKLKKSHLNLQKQLNQLYKKRQQDDQVLNVVRLLAHEISRIVFDRLNNQQDRILFREFFYKTFLMNFCTELEFHNDPNTLNLSSISTTIGKKQVKFKLGLVSDRSTMGSLQGPILHFGRFIGLPKIKDPSKITNQDELIDKLILSNYFSKEILLIHGDMIGEHGFYSNQYQQISEQLIQQALQSCEKKFQKYSNFHFDWTCQTIRHLLNLVRIFSLQQTSHALLRTNHQIGLGREDFVQFSAYICRQQYFNAHLYIPMLDENQSVRECLRSICLLAGLKQKNAVILLREELLSNEMIEQIYIFTREGTYPGLYSNDELIRIAAALSPGLPINRRVIKTNSVLKTFYARIRKRIHLVILENHQQIRHKGLFSSCYVDEYQSWNRNELISICKYWIQNQTDLHNPFESSSTIDTICQSLSDIYLSLDKYQYFTLKNLRKSIDFFFKFYENIQQTEKIEHQRCQSILDRSQKSERIIEMNKKFHQQLQNEIDILQEQLSKLDQQFQIKKKHFSTIVEDCREEEKLINEMSIALDRLRQDAQSDVEKANPQYENALHALKMLNKNDYDEIRTFRQPPQPVLAVMNTICIMFNKKPEWSEAKILMVKENFFDDLIYYDKENLSDEIFDMLTKIVQFDTFRPSFVSISSKAAASLCSWILAVYQYAKIARSQRTKLEQVKAYQELFNKRQHILGEKRLRAEKIKEDLTDLINQRRQLTTDLQNKSKRQNHFQSTMEKTRSMLKYIHSDIDFFNQQIQQSNSKLNSAITNALLTSIYFAFLSQFNIDQRNSFIQQWRKEIFKEDRSLNTDFQPLNSILKEKELNEYLLKHETTSIVDSELLLNALILLNQLENTLILFVHNPEDEKLFWKDLLTNSKLINEQKAIHEVELYNQYKQNQTNLNSANTTDVSLQDRNQLYSRASSSKTYVTELTEKTSLWESSTAISKPATSVLLTKSAGTIVLSDMNQNQRLIPIPEYSLEEYQRPPSNLIYLSGKQNQKDFDQILLSAMFFGVIVIIDECDFLELNPFVSRFFHWSQRRQGSLDRFPNLFRFGDQEIFVNSQFRLILNYRHIDRFQWKNLLLKNRFVDLSLSLTKLEHDLWLNLVEFKCQTNFLQQIRTNQRSTLCSLNQQYQRRENLIDLIETKENLTIDSEELLKSLIKSNDERILIENSLNEHRIQRDILTLRTGAEFYHQTSTNLVKFYILLRDSNLNLNLSFHSYKQILFEDFPKTFSLNSNLNSNENLHLIHKVQSKETYLRCFQSIYSYLSLALDKIIFQLILIVFSFLQQNQYENIDLLKMICQKFNSSKQNFVRKAKQIDFLDYDSWLLCQNEVFQAKYPNLCEHFRDFECQWKEYLTSRTSFDFINKTPFERTNTLNIYERFLLFLILKPTEIKDLIDKFLIYHYQGFLQEKSFEPIEQISHLQSTLNLYLVWIDSNGYVDPIDDILRLANQSNESIRVLSSVDSKSLKRLIENKNQTWLIIKDIHLFDDHLLFIRDYLFSIIEKKIWLICNSNFREKIPHWLTERAYQINLKNFDEISLSLRLQQRCSTNEQTKQLIHIHTNMFIKQYLSRNSIEKDFFIDYKHFHNTNQQICFDYRNSIENVDQQLIIEFIRKNSNPLIFIDILPNRIKENSKDLVDLFEKIFSNKFIEHQTNDDHLLVQSMIRTYLTRIRSIDSSDKVFSRPCSSLIDVFVLFELNFLRNYQKKLLIDMENLLDTFNGTHQMISSILDEKNVDFIDNYSQTFEYLSNVKSNRINLKFIKRRKQLFEIFRLEQRRKQDENLMFHLKSNENEEENLSIEGIRLKSNSNEKSFIISLNEYSSNQTSCLSSIQFDNNENQMPSYLPIVNYQKNDNSQLIQLAIDRPHI